MRLERGAGLWTASVVGIPYMERRLSRALFLMYRNLGTFSHNQGTKAMIDAHGYVKGVPCFAVDICKAGNKHNISAWGLGCSFRL